jgi:hypothetical protein
MNWDNESITIKGERLMLTKRGKIFFGTVNVLIVLFIALACSVQFN